MSQITTEEIKKLYEQASTEERKFFLELQSWQRPGPSYDDWGGYEILYGDVTELTMSKEYNYPTTDLSNLLIIPKTRRVVLLFREKDYEDRENETLYIFGPQGWKNTDF
jgi:hypothetical protein